MHVYRHHHYYCRCRRFRSSRCQSHLPSCRRHCHLPITGVGSPYIISVSGSAVITLSV